MVVTAWGFAHVQVVGSVGREKVYGWTLSSTYLFVVF